MINLGYNTVTHIRLVFLVRTKNDIGLFFFRDCFISASVNVNQCQHGKISRPFLLKLFAIFRISHERVIEIGERRSYAKHS